jgi:putative flippase GtrA
VLDWYATPTGKKMFRYTMVSVVAVPVGEIAYLVALKGFAWTPTWSGIFGAAIGAIPSYYLNRSWAWGKTGPSHLWKEVVPFWLIALLGVLFSGVLQHAADHFVHRHHITGFPQLVILNGAYLGGFALLWVVKYVIFNRFLFVIAPDEGEVEDATVRS